MSGAASMGSETHDYDIGGWADDDMDILTRTCPKCGASAEYPDCEACGHRFDEAPGTVTYTVWPDVGGKTIQRIEGKPWTQLTGWIESQAEYKAKVACPLVKLASFGPQRTENGSLRHDLNVVEVFGIEGDYDAGEMTPEQAVSRLEEFQVRATVCTSWSHTPEVPKWRVLVPLARPVEPARRLAYAEALNGMLGGVLAPESGVLSQSYFVGRRAGAEFKVLHTFDDPADGFCLDEIDGIEAERIPFRAKAEAAKRSRRHNLQGTGRLPRRADGRGGRARKHLAHGLANGPRRAQRFDHQDGMRGARRACCCGPWARARERSARLGAGSDDRGGAGEGLRKGNRRHG